MADRVAVVGRTTTSRSEPRAAGPLLEELWSREQEARAVACQRFAQSHDLVGALFAIEDSTPEAAVAGRATLDTWARTVRMRSRGERGARAQATLLAELLGAELGFRGDSEDYNDPRNSHLGSVIERRRGLPILLSTVWMHVGSRAGFRVEGVGLPGHFIVRIGEGIAADDAVHVDPFAGGVELSLDDCKRIVREATRGTVIWRDELLNGKTSVQIVERVLVNLMNAVRDGGDGIPLFRYLSFLARLRPDVPQYALRRAIVGEELGAYEIAARIYGELIQQFPGTQEAALAAAHRQRGRARPN